MSDIKLYQGDCLEIMKDIPNSSVDLVLCDLPYGFDKTRAKWDKIINISDLFNHYFRIVKEYSAIILFGNEPFSSMLRINAIDYYKYDIKWIKNNPTGFLNANYRPMNQYEDILIFSKSSASVGGKDHSMIYNPQGLIPCNKECKNHSNRYGIVQNDTNNVGSSNSICSDGTKYVQKFTNYPSNVVHYNTERERYHPTQKPVELLKYLINTYTNENMTVLDNCMGSGSTGVACINTNRNFIGIELNEKYFNVAKQRIENTESDLSDLYIKSSKINNAKKVNKLF